ncbi:MAG: hypothetical protein L6V78_03840 [Clostridium sp.]|nr:MAG: hypothetical protein L6V78_03840 [Clostridium sp.]
MYCKYCGSEVKGNFFAQVVARKIQEESKEITKETSGFGYGIFRLLFPLIGFIFIFLVYLNDKKKRLLGLL